MLLIFFAGCLVTKGQESDSQGSRWRDETVRCYSDLSDSGVDTVCYCVFDCDHNQNKPILCPRGCYTITVCEDKYLLESHHILRAQHTGQFMGKVVTDSYFAQLEVVAS